ncbi:MAG: Flp family type IVb pilin [Acidobacteriota bacterium]|nr:Flp family type IVb pilin [Acidobacteriota bacterium]
MNALRRFLADEQGQDLIEYTLLIAFISLATAALFVEQGGSVQAIWNTASSQLSNAAVVAGS